MARRQVLLVDGNDDFLEGLASWLRWTSHLEVVGMARSGAEAIEQVDRVSPELVLMDSSLPDITGFEVTRRIRARRPAPLVVLMTFHESPAAARAALAAGADGCVSKIEITDRLFPMLEKLAWPPRRPDGSMTAGMDPRKKR